MSLIKEIVTEANKNWPSDAEVEEFFAKRKMQPLTKRQRIGDEEDFVDVFHNEFGQRFTDREALNGVEDKMARRAWQWYSNNKWPAMESFLEEAVHRKTDSPVRYAIKDVTTGKYLMQLTYPKWEAKIVFTANPMNAMRVWEVESGHDYIETIKDERPDLKDHEFKVVKIKRKMIAHEVEEDEEVSVSGMKGITVRREPDDDIMQRVHTVLKNGKPIGIVWRNDDDEDWQAEVSRTGNSWSGIDSKNDAIKAIVDEA